MTYLNTYDALISVLTKMCDYDCVEALELGAMVLIQEEKYELAEGKIQKALQQEGKVMLISLPHRK